MAELSQPPAETTADPRDRVAFLISGAASPYVVLPLFILLMTAEWAPGWREAVLWAAVGSACVVGLPLGYIAIGVRRGRLTDIHVQLREQRGGPFLAALFGAALAGLGLHLLGAPDALVLAAAAVVLNGAVFALITRRWKISMHPSVLAACAVLAGRTVAAGWFVLLAAVPLVIWARVRRGRHNWAQGAVASLLAVLLTAGLLEGWLAWLGERP